MGKLIVNPSRCYLRERTGAREYVKKAVPADHTGRVIISMIAGNGKAAHLAFAEVQRLMLGLHQGMFGLNDVEVLIATNPMFLRDARALAEGMRVVVAAEDHSVIAAAKGAFTAEVLASALVANGITDVILGHSERRQGNVFGDRAAEKGETSLEVALKVGIALQNEMRPIICVGETEAQRDAGEIEAVLEEQVGTVLAQNPLLLRELKEDGRDALFAYEPVWAIGTGKAASPEDADAAIAIVREIVFENRGKEVAEMVRVLYGGSVDGDKIDGYMAMDNIDGALVGGKFEKRKTAVPIVRFGLSERHLV